MFRAILVLLLLATRVNLRPQTYQHQHRVFMSQMTRDNFKPVQTGFVFSQMNNNPATYETFGHRPSGSLGDGFVKKYSDIGSHESSSESSADQSDPSFEKYDLTVLPLGNLKMTGFDNSAFMTTTDNSVPYTTKSWIEQSIKYEIAKAKSKYGMDPLLSVSTKSNQLKDRMLSLKHTLPSDTLEDKIPKYDFSREFHIDDDDVKTSSRNTYEWWPYFSHSPYEYEHLKIDSDIQKAKEKRYAIDSSDRVIPVHESHDDYSSTYGPIATPPTVSNYYNIRTTDNPIQADEPFFSFVLNDYFDKNKDEDSLIFKGLEWGTDFDTDNYRKQKDYGKRDSPDGYSDYLENRNANNNEVYDGTKKEIGDSVTERGYDKLHKFDKHENGETHNENHKSDQTHSGNNDARFKNFVDQFANKFGGEDHKRHSNFALKTNKENNEKRKGFRRVYHKDEYQEDNEFFDNTGNSAKSEDSGSSTAHAGGSVADVQSHAAAVAGNEANSFNNVGNTKHNKFVNKHKGNDTKHGLDRDFNRYIDIAKQTARSNAGYYD